MSPPLLTDNLMPLPISPVPPRSSNTAPSSQDGSIRRNSIVERISNIERFFLGSTQHGLPNQRVTLLEKELGMNVPTASVFNRRVRAMETLRRRLLWAHETMYGETSIDVDALDASSILEEMETGILDCVSRNATVVARIEELEFQLELGQSDRPEVSKHAGGKRNQPDTIQFDAPPANAAIMNLAASPTEKKQRVPIPGKNRNSATTVTIVGPSNGTELGRHSHGKHLTVRIGNSPPSRPSSQKVRDGSNETRPSSSSQVLVGLVAAKDDESDAEKSSTHSPTMDRLSHGEQSNITGNDRVDTWKFLLAHNKPFNEALEDFKEARKKALEESILSNVSSDDMNVRRTVANFMKEREKLLGATMVYRNDLPLNIFGIQLPEKDLGSRNAVSDAGTSKGDVSLVSLIGFRYSQKPSSLPNGWAGNHNRHPRQFLSPDGIIVTGGVHPVQDYIRLVEES